MVVDLQMRDDRRKQTKRTQKYMADSQYCSLSSPWPRCAPKPKHLVHQLHNRTTHRVAHTCAGNLLLSVDPCAHTASICQMHARPIHSTREAIERRWARPLLAEATVGDAWLCMIVTIPRA